MNSETKISIGKYMDGELEGEALLQFEKLLKTDADLQEEIRFQKEIFTALKAKSEFEAEKEEVISFLDGLEKKVDLSNLENETAKSSTTKKPTTKETVLQTSAQQTIFRKLLPFAALAAAAAVLLLIIAPWKSNLTSTQLADAHFETFPLESVRSNDDKATIYDNIQQAYQEKNYASTITSCEAFLKENPNSPKIILVKGSAEYQLNKLEDAISSFQQVLNQNPSYKPLAQWYLALCYLKQEDKTQAKIELRKILTGDEKYKEAQKLLNKL